MSPSHLWQILLVFVSLSKICSGSDGGWVVTKRLNATTIDGNSSYNPIAAAFAPGGNAAWDAKADAKDPAGYGNISPSSPAPRPWYEDPSKTLMA